jgi:methyltransferase
VTPLIALALVLLAMLVELRISRRNEQTLRARGAVEPSDPAYGSMRWVYPCTFGIMTVESLVAGHFNLRRAIAGTVLLTAAKIFKAWAIHSLGNRWTYRVFVLPQASLVTRGPYRWIRHPNYVAVVGELVGFAVLVAARWTGPASVLVFGTLLRQRIRSEEQALGLSRPPDALS